MSSLTLIGFRLVATSFTVLGLRPAGHQRNHVPRQEMDRVVVVVGSITLPRTLLQALVPFIASIIMAIVVV